MHCGYATHGLRLACESRSHSPGSYRGVEHKGACSRHLAEHSRGGDKRRVVSHGCAHLTSEVQPIRYNPGPLEHPERHCGTARATQVLPIAWRSSANSTRELSCLQSLVWAQAL